MPTWPIGYRVVRVLVRLLLWLFYREIVVVNADCVPRRGGLVTANPERRHA